ncbi:hypothetical protein [Capnocytophaga canis]|uniref:DUF3408 domain-containing protein n=1 Tax=Capnocytophaga canis TaxID=1848903 RepID=A0A0B7ILR3_9FLAO|nr:hypothetical protein [Capnocytophaga canis]CEN52790.1 conserved hypothetical protein [Capnocytophaga canis]
MAKLKPKEVSNAGSPKSISSIASLLRGGERTLQPKKETEEIAVPQQEEREQVVEPVKETQNIREKKVQEFPLSYWIEKVGDKQYNCKEILYVDEEIKEVFGLLKSKGKIQISSLVSLILEEWLEENKDDVLKIINSSKNRFL